MTFVDEIINEQTKISKQIDLLVEELPTLHDEKEWKKNIDKQINLTKKSGYLVSLLQREILTAMKVKSSP